MSPRLNDNSKTGVAHAATRKDLPLTPDAANNGAPTIAGNTIVVAWCLTVHDFYILLTEKWLFLLKYEEYLQFAMHYALSAQPKPSLETRYARPAIAGQRSRCFLKR